MKAKKVILELTVNDEDYEVLVAPHWTLLEVLREKLELIGTKEGCGEGVCGSCTVLVEGRPVRSCLTLALEVRGLRITTIEGLAQEGRLDPLQDAFIKHGAIQCGFCSPGMILTARALLQERPQPTETEAREAIAANICRCTGYSKIVEAIVSAGQNQEGGHE